MNSANVDQDAASQFDKGGKPNYTTRMVINRRRIAEQLVSFDDKVMLDAGFGYGGQTIQFAPICREITALDIEPHKVEFFTAQLKEAGIDNITPQLADLQSLDLQDETFDIITSFEVLDHVDSEELVLAEMRRVLKSDGHVVMSVPNKWWLFETHGANLPLLKWNRVPFFSWLPKKLHDRWAKARIYSRGDIRRLLQTNGYTVKKMLYMTAPMDELKNKFLHKLVTTTLFRGLTTRWGILATSIMVLAQKRPDAGDA